MKLFLLPAFLCTLTTSCLTDQGSQRTNGPEAGVVPGWFKSAYRLSEQQRTRLRDEAGSAQQDGNREVCGALILPFDGNGSLELVFADNESRHAHTYELSAQSVRRMRELARVQQADLVGTFHSHPTGDATPGRGDLASAGVNSLILIHSVPTGQTRLWRVLLRGETKKAREVQLGIAGRRLRGPSPLAPSPQLESSHSSHDLRTP